MMSWPRGQKPETWQLKPAELFILAFSNVFLRAGSKSLVKNKRRYFAILIKYMYCTSIRKMKELKLACFSYKGSLTMIVKRPMPTIALSSSSHFGMIRDSHQKNQVRLKEAKCCWPQPISKFPKIDWSESRPLVPE